jgi:hypothetical protein
MNLHIKDMALLEKFKYTLGVGSIRTSKTGLAMFSVTSVKGLQVIVDHFDKYPLISAKSIDFSIFKQCFEIIKEKKHLASYAGHWDIEGAPKPPKGSLGALNW